MGEVDCGCPTKRYAAFDLWAVVGFFQNRPECKEMQEIFLNKAKESLVPLSFLFVLQKTLDSFLEFWSLSVAGARLACRRLA